MKIIAILLCCLAVYSLASATDLPTEYNNPIDGRTYVAPGGWKTYGPDEPADNPRGKVQLKGIMLLTAQDEIARHTTAEEISGMISTAEELVSEVFKDSQNAGSLLIQFDCAPLPRAQVVKIASQGDPPAALLQELHDKLAKLNRLKTTGNVSFQAQFDIIP